MSTIFADRVTAHPVELQDMIFGFTFAIKPKRVVVNETYKPPPTLQISSTTRARALPICSFAFPIGVVNDMVKFIAFLATIDLQRIN